MLAPRFNALKERLDGLKAGRAPSLGLLERARAVILRDDAKVQLEALRALDDDLERAGVHTSADARLLRDLSQAKGRLGALSRGLAGRAEKALAQYEVALREAERLRSADALGPPFLLALDEDFDRLARIVKVAAVFSNRSAEAGEGLISPRRRHALGEPPALARLAAAEFFAARAQANVADTAQKRKDLDLAHELLLRMSADAKQDRDRLRRLRVEVSAARDRVRSAPAVRSLADLVRHLRHAARRDPRTAFRSVRALYDRAVEAGDAEVARVAGEAVRSLLPPGRELTRLLEEAEVRRLAGFDEVPRFEAGAPLPAGGKAGADQISDMLAQVAFELDEDRQQALELAAGCARYFDVEDALTEDFVEAELAATRPMQRRVPYPTQLMTFEHTGSLDEVHNFVVAHPGMLLLDLASNRQLVRSYVEEQEPPKPKRVKKTAVRVYVLDASGSMHGARARFRDAILIAELNAIRVKARLGVPFDPLYFAFFNDAPTELTRVDSGPEATRQIEKLFRRSPAEGQTDISLALMSVFDSIRNAQGKDPYLARATAVLVTDGEDGVDLELIRKTKRPFEGLDIALSFISLGEENPDLKSIVLEQREQGGRAFYHHLSDAEIALARTEFDSAWRTLLPQDAPPSPDALEKLLPHLEALDAIAQGRPAAAPERSDEQFDALFPEAPARSAPPAQLVQRLADVLEAVAEAASLAPADVRAADAVALLSHLLKLYGVPVQRYLEALGARDAALGKARERVRLLCRPFG